MNRSAIGALLLVVIGILGIAGWYFLSPVVTDIARDLKQRSTSDAGNITETVRVAGDNYLGYWFITSPELRRQFASQGKGIEFTDDGGAYEDRLQKFADGSYDAIVLPVNSYLEHGAKHKFPGAIAAVISESRGADGIAAYVDRLKDTTVNSLNRADLTFVYTGASPSEFLLNLTTADFDLDQLRTTSGWRKPVESSRKVYESAKNKQGDVFVLWEPDLSKALELPGMSYIWGSDKFSGYIVDVFVMHRDFLSRKPDVARAFLATYFRVLDIYGMNQERMVTEMTQSTNLKKDTVKAMLPKIEWFDLRENARLGFGVSEGVGGGATEGVVNTIVACTNVLLRSGTLTSDPLVGNPYTIIYSSIVKDLSKSSVEAIGREQSRAIAFSPLSEDDWNKLKSIGTTRVEPIAFQAWDNALTNEGKNRVDEFAKLLTVNYPQYRVLVRGHTGPSEDESANLKMSLERAEMVTQRLIAVHGIDLNRLHAQGMGSRMPPDGKQNESERAYRYRLARVEFILLEPNPL